MSKPSDLLQGTLDLLILKILAFDNRRANFYSLTRAGQKHLNKETANWDRGSAAITRVLTRREA